jgi:hypothetical protein
VPRKALAAEAAACRSRCAGYVLQTSRGTRNLSGGAAGWLTPLSTGWLRPLHGQGALTARFGDEASALRHPETQELRRPARYPSTQARPATHERAFGRRAAPNCGLLRRLLDGQQLGALRERLGEGAVHTRGLALRRMELGDVGAILIHGVSPLHAAPRVGRWRANARGWVATSGEVN